MNYEEKMGQKWTINNYSFHFTRLFIEEKCACLTLIIVVSVIITIVIINESGCNKWSNLKTTNYSFHFNFYFDRLKLDVDKQSQICFCSASNSIHL